jgi:hypothetical protein
LNVLERLEPVADARIHARVRPQGGDAFKLTAAPLLALTTVVLDRRRLVTDEGVCTLAAAPALAAAPLLASVDLTYCNDTSEGVRALAAAPKLAQRHGRGRGAGAGRRPQASTRAPGPVHPGTTEGVHILKTAGV